MVIPMQNPYGGIGQAIPGAVSAFYGERDRQAKQVKLDTLYQQGQQDRQQKQQDRQRNEQDAAAFMNQSQFVAGLQQITDDVLDTRQRRLDAGMSGDKIDESLQVEYQRQYDGLVAQFPEVAGVRPRPKSAPALANAGQEVEDFWYQTMHTAVANVMRTDPKAAASLMEQIKARKAQREATAAQRAESARRYDEGLQHKRDTAAATAGYRGATLAQGAKRNRIAAEKGVTTATEKSAKAQKKLQEAYTKADLAVAKFLAENPEAEQPYDAGIYESGSDVKKGRARKALKAQYDSIVAARDRAEAAMRGGVKAPAGVKRPQIKKVKPYTLADLETTAQKSGRTLEQVKKDFPDWVE